MICNLNQQCSVLRQSLPEGVADYLRKDSDKSRDSSRIKISQVCKRLSPIVGRSNETCVWKGHHVHLVHMQLRAELRSRWAMTLFSNETHSQYCQSLFMLDLIKGIPCASVQDGFTLQQTTRPNRQDVRRSPLTFQVSFLGWDDSFSRINKIPEASF